MATLRVGGHDLHYEVHGTGTPILGIHGSPSTALLSQDAAATLAALGRVVLYDRRGYHRSADAELPERLDLADQLDDAEALLDEVGGAPAVVIGRSTGGQIALALAVERPRLVTALVLLEPAVFALVPAAQAFADGVRRLALEADGPEHAVRAVVEQALGPGAWAELPADLRDLLASGGPAMLAEIRGAGLDLSERPFRPTDDDLARVTQPTLVVSGEESYPAARQVDDRLVAALPAAEHAVVGGGHLVDPANPAVLDFVGRVTGVGVRGGPG